MEILKELAWFGGRLFHDKALTAIPIGKPWAAVQTTRDQGGIDEVVGEIGALYRGFGLYPNAFCRGDRLPTNVYDEEVWQEVRGRPEVSIKATPVQLYHMEKAKPTEEKSWQYLARKDYSRQQFTDLIELEEKNGLLEGPCPLELHYRGYPFIVPLNQFGWSPEQGFKRRKYRNRFLEELRNIAITRKFEEFNSYAIRCHSNGKAVVQLHFALIPYKGDKEA